MPEINVDGLLFVFPEGWEITSRIFRTFRKFVDAQKL